jgi:hypothetical protein
MICAAAAVSIDLSSTFHAHQLSDSLLPALVSLQHWTPFFWLQDRVGMLVPLLVLPIRHPLGNLLVQDGLYIFSGLAAFLLLARYMLRDDTYPLVGMVSAAAFLALAPPGWCFNLFANTYYGVWLALGLGGLVVLDDATDGRVAWAKRGCGLALLILAHWVYCAAGLLLGLLIVCRALICRQSEPGSRQKKNQTAVALLFLAVALGVGLVFMKFAPEPTRRTPVGAIHAGQWPAAWGQLAEHTWSYMAPHRWPYLLLAGATTGCLLLVITSVRRRATAPLRVAGALVLAALAFALFLGTRRWIAKMAFSAHYTLPVVFFLHIAFVVVATAPLFAALTKPIRRMSYIVAGPVLLAAALLSFGAPSLQAVRDGIDHKFGRYSADIVAGGATHIAGGYWDVWPAVFHANLVLHEKYAPGTIWGITYRGEVTQPDWQKMDAADICVAVPAEVDSDASSILRSFGFAELKVVERRSTIYLLRPKTCDLLSKR